uniref:xylosyltransferase 2-like isoform X2 n=1 Tax=Myxine glutinosa TaxID=7769 RepID=UPI00358DF71E
MGSAESRLAGRRALRLFRRYRSSAAISLLLVLVQTLVLWSLSGHEVRHGQHEGHDPAGELRIIQRGSIRKGRIPVWPGQRMGLHAKLPSRTNQREIRQRIAQSKARKTAPQETGRAMSKTTRLELNGSALQSQSGAASVWKGELLRCNLKSKDALSALARASSKQCRREITNVACLHQEGKLMPVSLTSHCPLKEKTVKPVQWLQSGEVVNGVPIRIVFMLVVHGRAVRQLHQLFSAIYHSHHYYYIHVDQRSSYLHRQMLQLAKSFANVRMTSWRMATIWGGASLLAMYLRAMKDLLNMADWTWDFFLNLSASDFPVRHNDQLVAFLSKYRDKNFLKSHGRETAKFMKKQGLDRIFHECDAHMWRLGERTVPTGITMDGGSDWFALNHRTVDFIINSKLRLVSDLKQFFAFTLLPAESFFHTLLMNSEICTSVVDNNLRLTNWNRRLGCKCQYKHIVDWCGCSPNDFKPADYTRFKQLARPTFFARKFEASVSQSIISWLHTDLYGSLLTDATSLLAYWENEFDKADGLRVLSDTALTFYHAFFRLGLAIFDQDQQSPHTCSFAAVGHPSMVHLYFWEDRFQGYLVQQSAMCQSTGKLEELEALLTRKALYQVHKPTLLPRLLRVEVGSGWDPKERLFRNFGGLLGPYDEPASVQWWRAGPNCSTTVVWLDPMHVIASAYEVRVDQGVEVSHHRPLLKKPLRPGAWSLRILQGWELIAETTFLVLPLTFRKGQPMNQDQVSQANMGPPGNSYGESDLRWLLRLLGLPASPTTIPTHLPPLLPWLDRLLRGFWQPAGLCALSPSGCPHLPRCTVTSWSSHYPDLKSQLGPVGPDGRLTWNVQD